MTEPTFLYDPKQVFDLMRSCNCSEARARELLRRNRNDLNSAIQYHQLLMEYLPPSSPTPPQLGSSHPTGPTTLPSSSISSHHDPLRRASSTEGSQISGRSSPSVQNLEPQPPPTNHHKTNIEPTTPTPPVSKTQSTESLHNLDTPDLQSPDLGCEEWDFLLPHSFDPLIKLEPGNEFSLNYLVGAASHGSSIEAITAYLEYYDTKTVKQHINETVNGFPVIFYAVARNDDTIVRTFVEHGANVCAIHEPSGTPLLAFAIVHSETIQQDTTTIVATLLSLGASPVVIPSDLYAPYYQDLPEHGQTPETTESASDTIRWCKQAARSRLQKTANLTQRYHLDRATKIKKASVRHRQVAELKKAKPILGIPYFLVGQTLASSRLLQKLLSYLVIPNKRPLVLAFAGPSGHGKTELARRMGHLLHLDLEVVDCTIVKREIELFGPREPYVAAEKGSSINNFLANHSGQRCIVFLDEFEKTTSDIHQALLLPFDNGEYEDRRNRSKVDCSKTIWILATNKLDPTIKSFSARNPDILGEDETTKQKLGKQLSRELREEFIEEFGAPIAGRITEVIPFLPFSSGEQAVVAHKFLQELCRKVKAPVVLPKNGREQLLGNIRLRVRKDASVCRNLAAAEYNPDLGARSLATAVKAVEDRLVEAYLDEEEEITEGKGMQDFCVDVRGNEVVVYKAVMEDKNRTLVS
ncbi:P-loop containing nucleoside triphosphate hydrolase protein [Xylaria sp. FL1042]|nr:P-loop containing nucleoside triphosphate hydrolase protein [Xylaria sp. FL1042]